jgi:AraC-like DNA-binding protein
VIGVPLFPSRASSAHRYTVEVRDQQKEECYDRRTPIIMEVPVEAGLVYALADICQRFIGAITVVEEGVFAEAVRRLIGELPVARNAADVVLLWHCVTPTLFRGAVTQHELFHRCFGGECVFTPPWPSTVSDLEQATLASHMARWLEAHERAFDATHAWPAAVKAANLLRRDPRHDWYISELAQTVGASASTLQRNFRKLYGVLPQHYQTLVRLRNAATNLRSESGCVEAILLDSGCHSVRTAYRSFRLSTGMTLADVRRLTEDEFYSLMNGPLAVPAPGFQLSSADTRTRTNRHELAPS